MTDTTRYADTRNSQDEVETTPAPGAGRVLHGLSITRANERDEHVSMHEQDEAGAGARAQSMQHMQPDATARAAAEHNERQTSETAEQRGAGSARVTERVGVQRLCRRMINMYNNL